MEMVEITQHATMAICDQQDHHHRRHTIIIEPVTKWLLLQKIIIKLITKIEKKSQNSLSKW